MENLAQTTEAAKLHSNKTAATIIYILYAMSFFTGITAITAIGMNHVKIEVVAGTVIENHSRWQTRTFWFGLL